MSYEKNNYLLDDREPIIGTGNTFKYNTTDSLAAVTASGYFTFSETDSDEIGKATKVGDFIKVKASDGSRIYSVLTLLPTTLGGVSDASADSLDGNDVANTTDAEGGAIPIVFSKELAGGATADTSVTMANKVRVIRVDVLCRGTGGPSDTFVLRKGTSAITDTVDLSTATDGQILSVTTISKTNRDLDVGDGLSFYEVAGAASAPPLTVTAWVVKIA